MRLIKFYSNNEYLLITKSFPSVAKKAPNFGPYFLPKSIIYDA